MPCVPKGAFVLCPLINIDFQRFGQSDFNVFGLLFCSGSLATGGIDLSSETCRHLFPNFGKAIDKLRLVRLRMTVQCMGRTCLSDRMCLTSFRPLRSAYEHAFVNFDKIILLSVIPIVEAGTWQRVLQVGVGIKRKSGQHIRQPAYKTASM